MLPNVCLSVCLSVCLLATLHKKIRSDLYNNITTEFSLDKKAAVKFWKSSGYGSGSREFLKEFLPLWVGEIRHILLDNSRRY